jgi:aminoglycoside phosphotransferase (APT) family kinase protein
MTALDERAVAAWIGSLGFGVMGDLRFERVGHGQSNLTFVVSDAENRRWVLRRPPFGILAATAHDVAREHRILDALTDADVPVPRMLGLCTDPAITDAPLVLMEHVEGLVIDDMRRAEALGPAERGSVGLALVDTLARIHAVDLEATGLDTHARRAPYAERQLNRWQRQWEAVRLADRPEMDNLGARLRAALPPAGETVLVHGDFHLQNVIVDVAPAAVRAVLDWELCTLGDPIADLGTLLAYWPQPGDPAPAVFQAPALEGFPTRHALVEAYGRATGRSVRDLGFWHVLALWKIAVIGEGVLRRAQDDPGNAVPVATAKAVDDLIVRAEAVAEGVEI